MSYKFEEHQCPYCNHKFMVEMRGNEFTIEGSDCKYILTKCPRCGYGLYVTSKQLYGVMSDFVSEDDVELVEIMFT